MRREQIAERLRDAGLVETHYHVGPEIVPRRYDVTELAAAAREWGATVVLKNHTYATSPLAALARNRHGASFLGGVVLNRFVGGLNPDAILGAHSGNRTAVDGTRAEPPLFVWMPTVHAAAHLQTLGHGFDPRWSGGCCAAEDEPHDAQQRTTDELPVRAFDARLRPLPELLRVLQTIAATSSVLATGHLSAREVLELVPLALELGVPAVVVTHPHYPSTRLGDAELRSLARDSRVFIEHCFAVHTIERVPLEAFAGSLHATGCEQALLSTDFGQVHSEPFPEGSVSFAEQMAARLAPRFAVENVVAMMSANGRRLLALAGSAKRKTPAREVPREIGAAR